MNQSPLRPGLAAGLCVLGALVSAAPASANNFKLRYEGWVQSSFGDGPGAGPLAGVAPGDTAVLEYVVDYPGTYDAASDTWSLPICYSGSTLTVDGVSIPLGLSAGTGSDMAQSLPYPDGHKMLSAASNGELSTSVSLVGLNFLPGPTPIDVAGLADVRYYDVAVGSPDGLRFVMESFSSSPTDACLVGDPYCGPAATNSAGASGSIQAIGSATAASNDLRLLAVDLPPNAFGFFLASRSQGFVAMPGGSAGNLCLGGSIGRFVGPGEIQSSGAGGEMSLLVDLMALPQPNGPVQAQPGERWHFQAWHRDAVGGVVTSNFTNGVEVHLE